MRKSREVEASSVSQDGFADVGPFSEAERESINEQLEQLLTSEFFVNSKRLPAFLRFIVDKTLRGQTETLKERMVGIEVFGRPPDYDCSDSPVVRVTAAELRKRLDLYYAAPERDSEIRITLPPGSYVPTFQRLTGSIAPTVAPTASNTHSETRIQSDSPTKSRGLGLSVKSYVAFAVVVLAVSVLALHRMRPDLLEQFWQPILASKGDVALCFSQGMGQMPFQGAVPTDV